jgi:hypothetical protein
MTTVGARTPAARVHASGVGLSTRPRNGHCVIIDIGAEFVESDSVALVSGTRRAQGRS